MPLDFAKMLNEAGRKYANAITFLGHEQAQGIYDPRQVSLKYPVDPTTGFAHDDLSTLTSPLLTQTERDQILARLSPQKGTFMPSNLSDEELMNLVPPRYFTNDPVDVQAWRDYLGKTVFKDMEMSAEVVDDADGDDQEQEQE